VLCEWGTTIWCTGVRLLCVSEAPFARWSFISCALSWGECGCGGILSDRA
jgi:hypothetical protein